MKLFGTIAGILTTAFALLLFTSPRTDEATPRPAARFNSIKSELASDKAELIDVRTPEEYNTGHISDATLLPLQDIQSGALPDSPKDTRLYVYCRSGNRSAQAAAELRKAGYTDIVDLGGIGDVEAMGGTVTKS